MERELPELARTGEPGLLQDGADAVEQVAECIPPSIARIELIEHEGRDEATWLS